MFGLRNGFAFPARLRSRRKKRRTFVDAEARREADKSEGPSSVDLEALREKMAATIERAKSDDPKELRATIAKLKTRESRPGEEGR
jgi:hypothetical protein